MTQSTNEITSTTVDYLHWQSSMIPVDRRMDVLVDVFFVCDSSELSDFSMHELWYCHNFKVI